MSKKRKKNKKPVQNTQGPYKRFLSDAQEIMNYLGFGNVYSDYTNSLKREMYLKFYFLINPKSGNGYISNSELLLLTDTIRKQYREKLFNFDNKFISAYQLHVLSCCLRTTVDDMNKSAHLYSEEEISEGNKALELVSKQSTEFVLYKILNASYRLSSPDYKYFNLSFNPFFNKELHRLEYRLEAFGIPSQKKILKINGYNRPIYRLGRVTLLTKVSWNTVDTAILKDIYKGDKKELDVYIQSHALKRLSERLDLLDKEAINFALCENTILNKEYEIYKGYIFLKFFVHDIKVGYLVANIIDDKLIFRTFLFITHNSTPEGDKLKEITGLEKNDFKYWKIDRLSTLVNVDEEEYPEIIKIFEEAGLKELIKLKEKEFNVDDLQVTNLDGFMEFLNKSQKSMELIEDEEVIPEEVN
jgi:hypothetical protein